ncbi:MAG: lysylphosphatidylglycerol synthase transmembrane domain-containing protein [Romboutsia sp.]
MNILTKKQKDILQYTFLTFLIVLTTYIVFTTLDIKLLPEIIYIINFKYIILGFILILLYIILEGHIIQIIINSIQKNKVKSLGFKMSTMGLYYNLVTPLASGSQPMQVYALSKYKIPMSKAIAVIVNKTIIFQTVVTSYCTFLLFNNYNYLKNEMHSVIILVSTGVIINVVTLGAGFLIIYSPKKTKAIVNLVLNFIKRFKVFNKLENKKDNINEFIDEYYNSVILFIKDKKSLVKALIYTVIQLTLYFSIAYCIYNALSLTGVSYKQLLSLQAFLYMAVSPVPTPGNVGANEIVFLNIFKHVFPKEVIGYGVFLYGIFIYYFILVFCGICTVISHYKIKKINQQEHLSQKSNSMYKY